MDPDKFSKMIVKVRMCRVPSITRLARRAPGSSGVCSWVDATGSWPGLLIPARCAIEWFCLKSCDDQRAGTEACGRVGDPRRRDHTSLV